MKINNLLPIGSVVLLKGAEKRLMIIGVLQSDLEKEGKEYDYMGVYYPEGYLNPDFQFLFNHEDIEQIEFYGMTDPEREIFLNTLMLIYDGK